MEKPTKYLIVYDSNDETYEIEADSFRDCIVNFAKYTGNASNLLMIAFNGCSSEKDYIEMFNHFCAPREEIRKIYVIEKTIFDDSKKSGDCFYQENKEDNTITNLKALCKAAAVVRLPPSD